MMTSTGHGPGGTGIRNLAMSALGRQSVLAGVRVTNTFLLWTLLAGLALGMPPGEPWQTTLGHDHPLAGRIWDVAVGEFIDSATLVDRLRHARFVLLGEKHDNPDHHRLQAWLLSALIAAGRRPAVGFEMFTVADAPAIARQLSIHPTDAAGLADAVNWQQSGWPTWAMYQPIAEAALKAKLPIVATNLAPDLARSLGQSGAAALDKAFASRHGLDRPPAPDIQSAMAQEIRQAHCGYASETQVNVMLLVQRARDAQMAENLAAAAHQDGAVLIAGAGHVRRDYGIPIYLASSTPQAKVVSVAFLEVSRDRLDPAIYAAPSGESKLPFDFVWFTPRVDEDDPCAAFAEHLKKLQQQ
jgi:uncharacterized iron-regulated protein